MIEVKLIDHFSHNCLRALYRMLKHKPSTEFEFSYQQFYEINDLELMINSSDPSAITVLDITVLHGFGSLGYCEFDWSSVIPFTCCDGRDCIDLLPEEVAERLIVASELSIFQQVDRIMEIVRQLSSLPPPT